MIEIFTFRSKVVLIIIKHLKLTMVSIFTSGLDNCGIASKLLPGVRV